MLRLLTRTRQRLRDKLREWWLINRHYVGENILTARCADRVVDWEAGYAEGFKVDR